MSSVFAIGLGLGILAIGGIAAWVFGLAGAEIDECRKLRREP